MNSHKSNSDMIARLYARSEYLTHCYVKKGQSLLPRNIARRAGWKLGKGREIRLDAK